MIIANIVTLTESTPSEILKKIASNVKDRRLDLNLTQEALSKKAGLSYSTYRKFEKTGEISLKNLVMLSVVFDSSEEFLKLFSTRKYTSIDDILSVEDNRKRKRGAKNE